MVDTNILVKAFTTAYMITIARYVFLSTSIFFIFSVAFRKNKIRNRFPVVQRRKIEFLSSLWSLGIFSLVGIFLYLIKSTTGYSLIYSEVDLYGMPWFISSILLMAVFSDAYFYWVHRLMHTPGFYKKFHSFHHQFNQPTAFSGYSFDYKEAVILALSLLVGLLIIPMHPLAILTYTSFGIMWNSYVHCGYEIFPKHWIDHPIMKWISTSTHHYIHHQYYRGNYGLYFTFWDKWMKTENPITRVEFMARNEIIFPEVSQDTSQHLGAQ